MEVDVLTDRSSLSTIQGWHSLEKVLSVLRQ